MDKNIPHRLMLNFYAGENYAENPANILCLRALQYFSDKFSEMVINIAVDNVEDTNFIHNVQQYVLQYLYCKNIIFKVGPNTKFCESYFFKHSIIDKLDELDGLTFFTHNKGTNSMYYDTYSKTNVAHWILGSYYLSLNFDEELDKNLINEGYENDKLFYGSFLTISDKPFYAGTIYWMNCLGISDAEYITKVKMHNRMYAEMYPRPFAEQNLCLSHNYHVLYSWNPVSDNIADLVHYQLSHDESECQKYDEFYNKMIEGLDL